MDVPSSTHPITMLLHMSAGKACWWWLSLWPLSHPLLHINSHLKNKPYIQAEKAVNTFSRCSWHECGNFLLQSTSLWEFSRHISPGCIAPVSGVKGRSVLTGKQTSRITFKKSLCLWSSWETEFSHLNLRDSTVAMHQQLKFHKKLCLMVTFVQLLNFFLLLDKRLKTGHLNIAFSLHISLLISHSIFGIIFSNFSFLYYNL